MFTVCIEIQLFMTVFSNLGGNIFPVSVWYLESFSSFQYFYLVQKALLRQISSVVPDITVNENNSPREKKALEKGYSMFVFHSLKQFTHNKNQAINISEVYTTKSRDLMHLNPDIFPYQPNIYYNQTNLLQNTFA